LSVVDDLDEVMRSALALVANGGPRGVSETALIRGFPIEHATETSIRSGLDDLAAAGFVRRTVKTRTAGWVFVATDAGRAELRG
jgi:hypothetical protein